MDESISKTVTTPVPASPETAPVTPGPCRLWTLPFISFAAINFFIFLGFDFLLPTLSLFLESNQFSEAEIGRIYGVFTVSAVFTRMFAARWTLRLSALRLVALGLLSCGLASASFYITDGEMMTIGCRLLQGAGFGLASTLITALASQVIPLSRMGEGMGYLGLGTTVALALGPFFGIWLMEELGFMALFLCTAACYVAGMAVVWLMPNVELAALKAAPAGGPEEAAHGRKRRHVRTTGFQRPRPVLFSRLVIPQSTLMCILGTILCAPVVYMALFCKERGLPYAGHFFVICTIGVFISRLSAGRIHDRIGHPYVIVPSSLLLGATMLMLYFTETRNMIFTASLLYGFGIGALFPSLQALALSSAPLDRRTEASASFFNAYDFGFGLGALALGSIAGLSGSYATIYWVAALLAVLFLGFYSTYYLILHRRAGRPQRAAPDRAP